jgi:hypothetical protein
MRVNRSRGGIGGRIVPLGALSGIPLGSMQLRRIGIVQQLPPTSKFIIRFLPLAAFVKESPDDVHALLLSSTWSMWLAFSKISQRVVALR